MKWYERMFNFNWKTEKVKVYMPATINGDVHIELSTGAVKVPDDFTFENLNIKCSTGLVNVEANVNDTMISLNPDNVECICFRCHNKEHERFGFQKEGHKNGFYKPVQKKVYIVYGSPCAGKSTWVHDVATKDDLIVDIDNIWQMISVNDRYSKPAALKSVVFDVRDKMYDIIKYRSGKCHNAYIITGGAMKGDRDRLKQRIGADEMIFIDTDYDTCMTRLQTKGLTDEQKHEWIQYINDWFNKFQADEN